MNEQYIVGASQIFTLFFVMLGPLRILGPYFHSTKDVKIEDLQKLSWRAFAITVVALFIGGFVGQSLLKSWGIEASVMELTAGLVFAFFAYMLLFLPPKPPTPISQENPLSEAGRVAFSMVVTPYGMAVVILLLSLSQSLHRTLLILGVLLFVLILNLISMLFIREVMGKVGSAVMRFLGGVLGVLQAALAMQIIYDAVQKL